MAGSGKVTENTGLFISCASLEFPAASKSMVAQSFLRGEARQAGQLLKNGSVRLTVGKQDHLFEQAVSLDLKDGQFETQDEAFRSLRPEDTIFVKAEVSSPESSETTTQEIYLNATP